MSLTDTQRHALLSGLLVASVLALLAVLGQTYFTYLRVQVAPPSRERVVVIGGQLPTEGLSVGEHLLEVGVRTASGERGGRRVAFHVDARPAGGPPPGGPVGDGGPPEAEPRRGKKRVIRELGATVVEKGPVRIIPAERTPQSAPTLVGDPSFSSNQQRHGPITGTLLAHSRVRAEYLVSTPVGKYLVELAAQHDRPAPVKIAIAVNGKTWKVVTFAKGNGKFERIPVGILRNFAGGRISLRFLNDFFDRDRFLETEDERYDRNAFIDEIHLTPVE